MTDNEPDYSRENDILQFADEFATHILDELTDREWRERYSSMTDEERAFFFRAMADAFSDTTDA